MRIDIITLFPDSMKAALSESIVGRSRRKGLMQICIHQLREFSTFRNAKVDDTPFGGGPGMLLMAEPFARAIEAIKDHTGQNPHIIYMSPRGRVLNQGVAREIANKKNLIILCGHYEGIDERIIDEFVDEEISIGDYVLTGGELPAAVLVDAVSRMCEGVLSGEENFVQESHYSGMLEYPQYTRPEIWRNRAVPSVLLSGNHGKISEWKINKSMEITKKHRPDLL